MDIIASINTTINTDIELCNIKWLTQYLIMEFVVLVFTDSVNGLLRSIIYFIYYR